MNEQLCAILSQSWGTCACDLAPQVYPTTCTTMFHVSKAKGTKFKGQLGVVFDEVVADGGVDWGVRATGDGYIEWEEYPSGLCC